MEVAINIVRYNQSYKMISSCVWAALSQDYAGGLSVTVSENGSSYSIRNEILRDFGDNKKFYYVDNGMNYGFAGAHNLFISKNFADVILPLNPDAILQPDYVRQVISAFADPSIGASTGKMLKNALVNGHHVLDGTGITLSRSRVARERGQNQIDYKQYDSATIVFGVSGTASAYRRSALEAVRLSHDEYYDIDFFAYYEDFDLSWRLALAGYKCMYVPSAVVFHDREVGGSKKGMRNIVSLIAHRKSIPTKIKQWSWRNHLFCLVKNEFGKYLWRDITRIAIREFAEIVYMLVFEQRTLFALPSLLSLMPKMIKKRKKIQALRVIDSSEVVKWFQIR